MNSICTSILDDFISLDPENSKKGLSAWRPVIYSIVSAVGSFPDSVFKKYLPLFYKSMVDLILQVHDQVFREALHSFFKRCSECFVLPQESDTKESDTKYVSRI